MGLTLLRTLPSGSVKIARPALRYHGGKWALSQWIVSHFTEHDCYVEPFGGGGSVLLSKPLSFIEVYNDLNGDVVNFFRVLRDRPADLFAAIDLTPYSRQEFIEAQTMAGDEVERARRFYVWAWQGRGRAGISEPGGWRFMSRATRGTTPSDDWCNNQHLWAIAQRLKRVQIEHDDAVKVIARYDSPRTVFYVDPPYVQSTRGDRWSLTAYSFEMSNEDHGRLAELLHGVAGQVILSGYPSELYAGLYADWRRIDKPVKKDNGAGAALECLWINRSSTDLTLFSGNG